jgi:hypothetical protein
MTGHTLGDQWVFTSVQNPLNTKTYFACWDNANAWVPNAGYAVWHYADRANRTPMLCLAMNLLGSNPNTGMLYTSFNYGQTDDVFVYGPATTISTPVSTSSTTFQLASTAGCSSLPLYGEFVVRVGTTTSGDTLAGNLTGTTFTLDVANYGLPAHAYSAGTTAYCIQGLHLSQIPSPAVSQVYRWGVWFPAMAIDVGAQNRYGVNHGYRMGGEGNGTPWALANTFSSNPGTSDLWRRDLMNGIVFMRPWIGGLSEAEIDSPPSTVGGHPVCVQGTWPNCVGGPWYPLMADGQTGPATLSVDLREAEAAILLNHPYSRPQPSPGSPPPVCNAGPAQAYHPNTAMQLNGSSSSALDGGPGLNYFWQQISGLNGVVWANYNQAVVQPTITGLVSGTYMFQLTVTDSSNQFSVCTVELTPLRGPYRGPQTP